MIKLISAVSIIFLAGFTQLYAQPSKRIYIANDDHTDYMRSGDEAEYRNGFDPALAMRFSLEHQNQLVAGKVTGKSGSYGPEFSLFTVSDPGVLVWVVKPAEEGIEDGVILRLWNMNNEDMDIKITSAYQVVKCNNATHIETNGSEIKSEGGKLNLIIGHNRILTFRIFLK